MDSETAKHVAIIGAGIVGVSTAIWLQRAGHRVTLIDREGPAAGTSYGNGGVLAAIGVVPIPVPGLWKKAPSMLFDRNQPLFMRWSYLPKFLPFLMKFMGNAGEAKVNQIASAQTALLHDTTDQHIALAKGTGAEKFVEPGDYVFAYKDRAAYDADKFGWDIRRANGHEFHEMEAAEFAEYDPTLAGKFSFGIRCPNHGKITDPGAYVNALAEHVVERGGELVIADVENIEMSGETAKGVKTSTGFIEADEIIIATGIWSGPLAEKLGISVPMEAERGYHIEFVNPSITPENPIMVTTGKFVMTPMVGRLRCAGVVEFGGLSQEKTKAALDLLKQQAIAVLPDMTYDRIDEWLGFRPSTSDSLPLIGATSRCPNVWTGFGHQHVGLTAGPKTGRWLAQLIDGQKPNVDLAAYSPLRFTS